MLWDVPFHSPERLKDKVVTQARRRALALALIVVVGLILGALVLWNALAAYAHHPGRTRGLLRVSSAAFSFALTALFAAIFKVFPEARAGA